ncbi:MAG: DUF481 domain-containing protein [Halieaceae bacterium]|jgi:hypothetical protein|nr:DUF481 domain-containing protein [Halieaceae bacterium]
MQSAPGVDLLRCLAMLGFILWTGTCLAHPKTDVVILYNGDRLTGEIQSLRGGLLSLGTDAMGTVKVQWKDIAEIQSAYYYEVRLDDGRRLFGRLAGSDAPGAVTFADLSGDRSLDALDIVELRPIEERARERLDIYLSANYSFTKASGVQQSELHGDVDYDDENTSTSVDGRLTLSSTDEDSTASSRISFSRKSWTESSQFFRQFSLGHESNDELGLQSRYTIGGGMGRFFAETNRRRLAAGLGAQALQEFGADGRTRSSLEAVVSATLASWRFDTPELDLSVGASLYPSLTERRRLRADTTARIRWELVSDLFWNLNAWGSFDNASVDEAGGEFDWGVTTGLGWSF